MSWDSRELAIFGATVLAAFAVLASSSMLIADVAIARQQAGLDAGLVEQLEERARTDVAAAVELEAERAEQTETSLRREAMNRRLGWGLLVATAVFVTGAKRLLRDRQQSAPAFTPPETEAVHHPQRVASDSLQPAPAVSPPEPVVDLAIVDDLVDRHGRGREAAIPILQAIQEHYRYLPDSALRRLCALTEITPAQVAGASTFYAHFRHAPVGEHLVRLCHGTACHVAGVGHVDQELRRRLAIADGTDTDPRRRFTLEPVACLGCCSLAPVMMIGDVTAGHLTPASAQERLAAMVAS